MENFTQDPYRANGPASAGYFEEDHALYKEIKALLTYLCEKKVCLNIIVDGMAPKTLREMRKGEDPKITLNRRRGFTETSRAVSELKNSHEGMNGSYHRVLTAPYLAITQIKYFNTMKCQSVVGSKLDCLLASDRAIEFT